MDGDPDVFSYNFGGYSGKFIVEKRVKGGRVLIAKQNNLDIECRLYSNFEVERWVITTPDGFQYVFKTPEVSTNYTTGYFRLTDFYKLNKFEFENSNESVNSWYLDQIIDPMGNELTKLFFSHFH